MRPQIQPRVELVQRRRLHRLQLLHHHHRQDRPFRLFVRLRRERGRGGARLGFGLERGRLLLPSRVLPAPGEQFRLGLEQSERSVVPDHVIGAGDFFRERHL